MAFTKIILRPGVNTQQTPLLNEAAWSESQFVRFFQGLLQKLGGWQRITDTPLVGVCRGILAWADLSGNSYVAAGTDQRLQAVVSGNVYDITPIRRTVNLAGPFDVASGSPIVGVNDAGNGADANDWINIVNVAAVGGLVLQGLYKVTNVINATTYEVTNGANFPSTATGAGAAAEFTTANGSPDVTVTLANHGLAPGDVFVVNISTTGGGLTLFGEYIVQSVIDPDNFVITATSGATSNTSFFENGGNIRIQYLLPSGLADAGNAAGYGIGGYGLGAYGVGGSSPTSAPLRQWSMGAWGEFLLASPSRGALYSWNPVAGVFQNPATIIPNAPPQQQGFFLAMPQQQVVSFGCTDPGTGQIDPMLIRWCDVANYNDWVATAINQAGSYRIPRGSKIMSGAQGPQYGLLWTDLALWQMQYIQPPLVYGFTEIAAGCGLMAQRALAILGTDIYWPSQNGFFHYANGAVEPLPCPVWDKMFRDLFVYQSDKVCCGANTPFNEFFTFFPSAEGNGENDMYLKYSKVDGVWDYGSMVRTAWIDQSVYGNPLAVDQNSLIQQHESSPDADGQALVSRATSGWFKLNDGQLFVFLERMIPDFMLEGGATLNLTIYTADYPDDTPTVYGPYSVTNLTEYIIIRSRSRLARIEISGTADLGTFWRLGEMLYMATPSGRR